MSKTLLLFLTEMYYVIWELKKKTTKQNNWQKGKQHFKKMLKEILSNGLMTGPYGEDGREGSPEQGTGFMCFMSWSIWKESGKRNLLIGLLKGPPIKNRRTFGYPFFIYIQLFRDWGCRKKCTQQSRKVLWMVLSSLFFKGIWKNGTRGHGHMSVSAKGKQQK